MEVSIRSQPRRKLACLSTKDHRRGTHREHGTHKDTKGASTKKIDATKICRNSKNCLLMHSILMPPVYTVSSLQQHLAISSQRHWIVLLLLSFLSLLFIPLQRLSAFTSQVMYFPTGLRCSAGSVCSHYFLLVFPTFLCGLFWFRWSSFFERDVQDAYF